MNRRKKKVIAEELEMIEKRLANAEDYVAQGANLEGASFLHFDDWQGKSGHPLWMKNCMIPAMIAIIREKYKPWRVLKTRQRKKKLTKLKSAARGKF